MGKSANEWLMSWFANRLPGLDLAPEEDFYRARWIDSFAFLELLDELQTVYSLRIDFHDLADPSTKTIKGLAALVERKREQRVAELRE